MTAHELKAAGAKSRDKPIPYTILSSIQVRYEPTESKAIERFKEILIRFTTSIQMFVRKKVVTLPVRGQLVVKNAIEGERQNGRQWRGDIEELMDQRCRTIRHQNEIEKWRHGVDREVTRRSSGKGFWLQEGFSVAERRKVGR